MANNAPLSVLVDDSETSEMQRIVNACTSVLDLLSLVDSISSMEDLIAFVRTVSPALTKMVKEIGARARALNCKSARDKLRISLEKLKQYTPALVNSVKDGIAAPQNGKQDVETRKYFVRQISDEIGHLISVLKANDGQTAPESRRSTAGAKALSLVPTLRLLDAAQSEIAQNWSAAQAWLNDSQSTDSAALRRVIDACTACCRSLRVQKNASQRQIADDVQEEIRSVVSLLDEMAALLSSLSEMRSEQQGERPSAHSLERALKGKLQQLKQAFSSLHGKLHAIRSRRTQSSCEVRQFSLVVDTGTSNVRLAQLVSEATVDMKGPLRHLVQLASQSMLSVGSRESDLRTTAFERLANVFLERNRLLLTVAIIVEEQKCNEPEQTSEQVSLREAARKVVRLGPHVLNVARSQLVQASSGLLQPVPTLDGLRQRWCSKAERLRSLIDKRLQSEPLVSMLVHSMNGRVQQAEQAMQTQNSTAMAFAVVDCARTAERVLQFACVKAQGQADQVLAKHTQAMETMILNCVLNATQIVKQPQDANLLGQWKQESRALVQQADTVCVSLQTLARVGPRCRNSVCSARVEDSQADLLTEPEALLVAVHALHKDVQQWSSRGNEIIAAAKRLASLMAKLSGLMKADGADKHELLPVAKAINEASEQITQLATRLAHACNDRIMCAALLHACERIPTFATQLKIVVAVKAGLLASQGSKEDKEATNDLIANAKNLMEDVQNTVKAAESASIKMRVDAGISLKWHRKRPWYE